MDVVIMIVLMVAIFYFLLIRPENKKKKAVTEMRNSLKVGDEITTIGGVVGTICAIKEETIVMETGADRVRIEFTKWAISTKGTQTSQDATPETTNKKEKKEKKPEEKKDRISVRKKRSSRIQAVASLFMLRSRMSAPRYAYKCTVQERGASG